MTNDVVIGAVAQLVAEAHGNSKDRGFWGEFGDDPVWNFGEKVALIHSEVSEALEAHRKGNPPSEKIPEHSLVAEELADAVIRIADLCGKLGIDLGAAVLAKMAYNRFRPHKHGKAY